jgi:hypothetical protein
VLRRPEGLPSFARKLGIFALGYAAFSLTVIVHGYIRAQADDADRTTYSMGGLEHTVFHGMPSLWLQHWTPDTLHIFPALAFVVWSSLFYLPLLLCAIVLALKGPRAFFGLLAVHAVLVFSADVVYALAPTRPPWMDLPVTRIVADFSQNAVADDNNPFASSPSLHVGVPVIYALWFWGSADHRLRRIAAVLGAWAVLMVWSVVYTGEHYVLGAAAGALWGAAVYAALCRIGAAHARVASPLPSTAVAQRRVVGVPRTARPLPGQQRAA